MFFGKKKQQEQHKVKEYMKYEKGEVIPAGIEEEDHLLSTEFIIPETVDNIDVIKEDIDFDYTPIEEDDDSSPPSSADKVKSLTKILIGFKYIKLIAIGVFSFLLLLVGFDIYQTFTEPIQTQTPVKKPVQSVENPDIQTDFTDASTDYPSVNSGTEAGTENTETEAPHEETAVDILNALNNITLSHISITNKEIEKVGQYTNRKANRMSLENTIESAENSKERLILQLDNMKDSSRRLGLSGVYISTKKRVEDSLSFSENLLRIVNSSDARTLLSDEISNFSDIDSKRQTDQFHQIIQTLDTLGIEYVLNKETNELVLNN